MICTGARRPLPFVGRVPPDTISCTVPPATKRFYKKKRLSLSSSVSPSLSSLSVVAAPRCGYTPDLTTNSEKKGTANNNSIVGDFVTRFAILFVGCAIGFILYFPNVAMSDSVDIGSSREAVWAVAPTIGIVACRLFILGGCIGFVSSSKAVGWKALIPGAICQLVALYCFP
jgi:hypothetical protein